MWGQGFGPAAELPLGPELYVNYPSLSLQAEFPLTQVLDRPVTGRVFFAWRAQQDRRRL